MFDWITWSIWTLAFFILIVFIVQPIREFKRIYADHKESRQSKPPSEENGASETDA